MSIVLNARCMPGRVAVALFMAGSVHALAQAQVRYFDRVPTAEEVLAVFDQPAAAGKGSKAAADEAAKPMLKMRGLEWGAGTPEPTASAAPASADASGAALAFPVNFESGAARVSRGSLAYVEAIVAAMGRNPKLRLVVEGHTDVAGNSRTNLVLSWERAFSVFRLMVEKYGIDPARLQPAGKGSSELIVPSDPLNGMNRRVQFRVLA